MSQIVAPASGSGSEGRAPAPATPAVDGPSGNDTPGHEPQAQEAPAPPAIVVAANAVDAGSEVIVIAGSAPIGPAPLPQQASPIPVGGASSNARSALQGDSAESGMVFSAAAAGISGTALASSNGVRVPQAHAPGQVEQRLGAGIGESPHPSTADLIAEMVPVDRAALERAIDRFIDQLDSRSARELFQRGPARIILFSTAVAAGALGLEALRRRWQRFLAGGELLSNSRRRDAHDGLVGFPELPASWTSRFT